VRRIETPTVGQLMPAANSTERVAFRHFLDDVNRLNVRLPGDPTRRTLRFRCSNG